MLAALLVLAVVAFALGLAGGLHLARRRAAREAALVPASRPDRPMPLPSLASQLVAALDVGALVVDAADRVVLINPAGRAMDVVDVDALSFAPLAELVGAARAAGEPRSGVVDLPIGRLGREPTGIAVTALPLRGEREESGYVGLLLADVTEQRRLEAVRRDFVANVSHELKTPVGALVLLAEAVREAAGDPAAVSGFADRMQREGGRLTRLVADLMELSRVQGTDPLPGATPVAVGNLLTEALERTRLAAEQASIEVRAHVEDGLSVRGAQDQLATAVENLLANAIAYSPAGTQVRLSATASSDDDARPCVDVVVADDGVGIAATDLDRIFERFYRVDPARSRATGGTGLGLAIVKNIVTNHLGTVTVRSAPGKGSTFTIRLPRVHRDAACSPSGPAAGRPVQEERA